MKNFNVTIFAAISLTTFSLTSCGLSKKSHDQAEVLLEKENGLLKKEQDLTQKEVRTRTNTQTTIQQQPNNHISDNLDFLNTFDKKYPYETKLLDNPILKTRLRKMLGTQYDFMKSIWQVETPIEITDGIFYAWGMQAHSGGDPSAVLMADINKNVLYVGIRKDKQQKFYSEDGGNVPQGLKDWAHDQ